MQISGPAFRSLSTDVAVRIVVISVCPRSAEYPDPVDLPADELSYKAGEFLLSIHACSCEANVVTHVSNHFMVCTL